MRFGHEKAAIQPLNQLLSAGQMSTQDRKADTRAKPRNRSHSEDHNGKRAQADSEKSMALVKYSSGSSLNSNIAKIKEIWGSHLQSIHGPSASFITTGQKYTIPEPNYRKCLIRARRMAHLPVPDDGVELEPLEEEPMDESAEDREARLVRNAVLEARWRTAQRRMADKLFESDLKEYQKDKSKLREQKFKIFGFMIEHTSLSAKAELMQDEKYLSVMEKQNPIKYWKLCVRVLSIPHAESSVHARMKCDQEWNKLRMTSVSSGDKYNEKIHDFYARFLAMKEQLLEAGMEDRGDEYWVRSFLQKLAPQWAQLELDFQTRPRDLPATVEEAYSLALNYKVLAPSSFSGVKRDATVFAISMKPKKKARMGNTDNAEKKSSDPEQSRMEFSHGSSVQNSSSKKSKLCFGCGKPGHRVKNCPSKKPSPTTAVMSIAIEPAEPVSVVNSILPSIEVMKTIGGSSGLRRYEVGLDSMAQEHVIRDAELLFNIRPAPYSTKVIGATGEDTIDQVGDLADFGEAWYYPNGNANVISEGKAIQQGWVPGWEPGFEEKTLTKGGSTVYFSTGPRRNTFTCDMSRLAASNMQRLQRDRDTSILMTTTDERLAVYTKREVENMETVRRLYALWGYIPSLWRMVERVKNGIDGVKIGTVDVINAYKVFGNELPYIRGASRRRPRKVIKRGMGPSPGMIVQSDMKLFIDLMFVERVPFLVSVSEPGRMPMVNYLSSKKHGLIKEALFRQKAKYTGWGFNVTDVFVDGESGVAAIAPVIQASVTNVHQAGPETHVGQVENMVGQIKTGCRCVRAGLKFLLAKMLIVWLVYFVCQRLSMLPTTSTHGNLSPLEFMTGRRPDIKTNCALEFLQPVEVFTRTSNDQRPRTRPGLALVPVGNDYGSHKVLMLDTMKVATMDQWTEVPLSSTIIATMNELASQPGQATPDDMEFLLSNNRPVGDAPATNEPQDEVLEQNFGRREKEVVPLPNVDIPPDQLADIDPGISSDSRGVQPSSLQPSEGPDNAHDGVDSAIDHAESDVDAVPPDPNIVVPTSDSIDGDDIIGPTAPTVTEVTTPTIEEDLLHQADAQQLTENDESDIVHMDPPEVAQLGVGRYNLRPRRFYGHKDGDWRERDNDWSEKSGVTLMHISVKKALLMYKDKAKESMLKEVSSIIKKGVFRPIPWQNLSYAQRSKVIRSSMFLKEKFLSTGHFDKLKSRFVAGGNMQDRSLYSIEETASPTVSMSALYMLAAIAARECREIRTMDVGSAYLNAKMVKDVYMKVDPSIAQLFVQAEPSYASALNDQGYLLVKLEKALYGCVESAKLWYETLAKKLISVGFIPNSKDKCVFNKIHNGNQITIAVYVDDLFCSCVDPAALDWIEQELKAEFKELNVVTGKVHSYLGQTLDFNVAGEVKVTMEGFISDLLDQCNIRGSVATPATCDLFKVDESKPILSDNERSEFHSTTAKLLYLSKRARPDLLTALSFLTTRVKQPTIQDMDKLRRVLRYLNGSRELGLTLKAESPCKVFLYCDASFAVHPDFKSHTGAFITVGKGPVWTKSSRQKLNSKSSTEAELIGVSDALPQLIWTRDFLQEQGIKMVPSTIFQDNMSTIALMERGIATAATTRHFGIRLFFVKDRIEAGDMSVEYMPTVDMAADFLTKPLQGDLFRKMRKMLLGMA